MQPSAEESFEVLEGPLDVFQDGGWTTLRAGDTATAPPNAPHTFRNSSDESANVVITIRPAGRDWTRPTGPLSGVLKTLAFTGKALRFKL